MKVIEQYYGPVRRDPYHDINALRPMTATEMNYFSHQMECYIRVEVNGKRLHVKSLFPRDVPAKHAIRSCQMDILQAVGKEVFGG